jgi:hypothetical protein
MALDIIFLSYDEPNADINFSNLATRFPYVKRVHGVQGIANAHKAAAEVSDTRFFYVIDGDTEVLPNFDFTYKPETWDQDYVHIWRARNPVNGLEYGYGGVKMFSKKFFKNLTANSVDFSTSLTKDVKYLEEVVSITHFNSDEFRAYRGAFRECAKLASKSIEGQVDQETEQRLHTWCNVADKSQFYWKFVLMGANAGLMFGLSNIGNPEELKKVNDFNWLKDRFEKSQGNAEN